MAIKILSEIGLASRQPEKAVNSVNKIKPTFFFDPASQKQKESAVAWADIIPKQIAQKTTKWVKWLNDFETEWVRNPQLDHIDQYVTIRLNTPMENLYLDDIDVRMEGGRAYKVYNADDMTYFDVREDQMLQAILKYGIQPGGKIGGKWIFAMNHTQMKCYLEDGKEYQEALAITKKSTSTGKKVTSGFVVGKVYTDKTGQAEYIYVGRFPNLGYPQPTRKLSILDRKNYYFLSKTNGHGLYGRVIPNGYDIISYNTVYESSQNDVSMQKLKELAKLVQPNLYRSGTYGNIGYVWGSNYNFPPGIVWKESKDASAYYADMFLNGIDSVNLPKFSVKKTK